MFQAISSAINTHAELADDTGSAFIFCTFKAVCTVEYLTVILETFSTQMNQITIFLVLDSSEPADQNSNNIKRRY